MLIRMATWLLAMALRTLPWSSKECLEREEEGTEPLGGGYAFRAYATPELPKRDKQSQPILA